MATTTMTVLSNRRQDIACVVGTVTSVPLDAVMNEFFRLPVAFGDLICESVETELHTFSGAYVAPAPAYDGHRISVIDQNVTSVCDWIGTERFVHEATASTRPVLAVWLDLQNKVLVRQNEYINVSAPILAGAGVTATLILRCRGRRLRQA